MGNRANIVVVKDGDWQLYYSHWAGCRMLDALVAGPDFALRYFESLRPCTKDEWTHPLWLDGGAVLDLDRRRLLFFGEEVMVDMRERRALLTALAAVWRDYAIGWAYDGIAEIGAYVGAEMSRDPECEPPKPKLARNRKGLCQLVSVAAADGRIRLWPLWWGFSDAWHGPELLNILPGRGVSRLALGRIPESGIHIDESAKTAGIWHTSDRTGIFRAFSEVWSGWQTECWEDRFEEQVIRCNGALRVPELNLVAGIDSAEAYIRQRVYQSFADSPVGRICAIAELVDPLAPGLVVSDNALTDCEVRPSNAEWALFAKACNLVREAHRKSA